MSEQNRQTLAVYERTAKRYMANSLAHAALDPEKAHQKLMRFRVFLGKTFSPLPEHARIFEIGSADGEAAKWLERIEFDVTASDVADDFIAAIADKGLKVVKFNALTDKFPGSYHGILCWRVFVHFTPKDAYAVMKKAYAALEERGRFAFNAMNRAARGVDEEWADFPGEYRMGAERYFHYYTEAELREIAQKVGFRIIDFHLEGGERRNKWLVFVLEKP